MQHGVYYCADRLETAIAETALHFEAFARDSNDSPRREDMRVLLGSIDQQFHDIGSLGNTERSAIPDPASYIANQALATDLRATGSNGVLYPSVRDPLGLCVGAFWPDVVGIPVQERHLKYDWDGNRVSRCFDYSNDTWVSL